MNKVARVTGFTRKKSKFCSRRTLTCNGNDSEGICVFVIAERILENTCYSTTDFPICNMYFAFLFFPLKEKTLTHTKYAWPNSILILFYCTIIYFGKFVSLFKVP